jgi:formamidopyrimidine-DNA glycosylase
MPELPEVETIVRSCRPRLVGRVVEDFEARWARQVRPDPETVRAALRGATVTAVGRRGKHIVIELGSSAVPGAPLGPAGWLLVHLRMSGRFEWLTAAAPEPGHVRAVWSLDDGARLALCDARKFGRIGFTRDLAAELSGLGPEPLDEAFTPAVLAALLRGRSRAVKPLLLDQSVVAGLGNIYTDEALHRAGIHPLTPAARLRPRAVAALHEAIRHVLTEGIRHNGTSLDWIYPDGEMQDFLLAYGRTGQPCPRCGAPIEALRVGQRGTHVCPRCQRRPGARRPPRSR